MSALSVSAMTMILCSTLTFGQGDGFLKAKGKVIEPEEETKLLNDITQRYNSQTTPYYAAARLWVDAIIDPAETRMLISEGIAAANNNNHIPGFTTGVFQV